MALTEQRAKDLAFIEPPTSIKKIAQFTEQLSFGQEALFSGTELPKPSIAKAAFADQALAQQIADRPYAMFPGADGEGLDTVMSRYTIRNRDIQDFTRWLTRWEDKRSQLMVVESPEQYFLNRATAEQVEKFEANPEVERIVREGRRRKRVIEEHQKEIEIEERVVKIQKSKEIRTVYQEVEAPTTRRRLGGHPRTEPAERDYAEYWRSAASSKGGKVAAAGVMGGAPMAAAAAAAPASSGAMLSTVGRGIVQSNLSLGSMTTGALKSRADATASFQAQTAATDALQQSPVSSYMQQPYLQQSYGQAPTYGVQPGYGGAHYPPPQVSVEQMPSGGPIEISTDWPGAPQYRNGRAAPAPQLEMEELLVVPKQAAESKGFSTARNFRPSPGLLRGAMVAIAAGTLVPFAFGGASGPVMAPLAYPGFAGVASQAFASGVAGRAMNAGPGQAINPGMFEGAGSSAMPAGSMTRKDMFTTGMFDGADSRAMGLRSQEGPVRASIPANPLMGQITIVSPPMQVASQESEQAGSTVSFDIRKLAKGAGALDAGGLAMLKSSLPPGASAIYPALPPGSLSSQAVNMRLAPSLLNQILTEGYGPQASKMSASILSTSAGSPALDGSAPMEASIVPTSKRPTDASGGVLGDQKMDGPGALQLAGSAGAQRGGALDFLGMPVRLAPSLGGNPEVKAEAEARKVLPGGAAGVMRPNEFGPMRSKLFPGFGTVHAEPDQGAWRKAAPAFGMASGEAHSVLAPDSRIRPATGGMSIPQIEDGGHTPGAKAIHAASLFSGAAAGHGDSFDHDHSVPPDTSGASSMPIGLGLGRHRATGLGGGLSMAGGLGSLALANRPSFAGSHSAAMAMPSTPSFGGAISSASVSTPGFNRRPPSRFTPFQPAIGLGPSGTTHTGAFSRAHAEVAIPMAHKGTGFSPRIPAVQGSASPAIPDMTHSTPSRAPSRTPPAFSTAGGGRPNLPTLKSPSMETAAKAPSPSGPVPLPYPNVSSRSLPEMPIATSVQAKPPTAAMTVQRNRVGASPASQAASRGQTEYDSDVNSPRDPGSSAGEINLLANEVWSLLKRKLTFEAERLGKRF
jgi:hypothetical protein